MEGLPWIEGNDWPLANWIHCTTMTTICEALGPSCTPSGWPSRRALIDWATRGEAGEFRHGETNCAPDPLPKSVKDCALYCRLRNLCDSAIHDATDHDGSRRNRPLFRPPTAAAIFRPLLGIAALLLAVLFPADRRDGAVGSGTLKAR